MAVTSSKFVYDPTGIRIVTHEGLMQAAMGGIAQLIVDAAKQIAPVGPMSSSDPTPGSYRDGLIATSGVDGISAYGEAAATDGASFYIEFGTSDTPTFAPLRRGAEAAGFVVTGGGP